MRMKKKPGSVFYILKGYIGYITSTFAKDKSSDAMR